MKAIRDAVLGSGPADSTVRIMPNIYVRDSSVPFTIMYDPNAPPGNLPTFQQQWMEDPLSVLPPWFLTK